MDWKAAGILAFAAAGLGSAAEGPREELARRCPGLQEQWKTALSSNGYDGDPVGSGAVRRTPNGFEVDQRGESGELFLRVELPGCASLGYTWWAEYAGGTHIPAAVHPMIWRGGARVSWRGLEPGQQKAVLGMMKAGLGSPASTSIAGALWRARHAAPDQQPPVSVDSAAGKLGNERRTFIPCPDPEGGWLFFGSRLGPAKRLDGVSISRADLGPTPSLGAGLGRVYAPPPWVVIHDLNADRTVFLPDDRGTVDVTRASPERAVILGGAQGCGARLLDLERLRVYALPGRCAFYDSGTDYAFLSGDPAGRLAWLKSGEGVAIDFAKVLQSQGAEGVERIPAGSTLAWGVAHKNLNVILTALLFAKDEQARDEVLATLRGFPGWQAPTESAVAVRAAAPRPRLLVEKEGGRDFEDLASKGQTYGLLGFVDEEALLDTSGAILAVPRSAIFSAGLLPRLEALHRATADHELYFGPHEDSHYVSYWEAVLDTLSRRPLTAREKQRACAVEQEVLAGHERWELEEIIDREVDGSWTPSDDDPEHPTRRRPAATVRAEWKSMCRTPDKR